MSSIFLKNIVQTEKLFYEMEFNFNVLAVIFITYTLM